MSYSVPSAPKKYRIHHIMSWYKYQQYTPWHLDSIADYIAECEEHSKIYDEQVIVLRDNVIRITGVLVGPQRIASRLMATWMCATIQVRNTHLMERTRYSRKSVANKNDYISNSLENGFVSVIRVWFTGWWFLSRVLFLQWVRVRDAMLRYLHLWIF